MWRRDHHRACKISDHIEWVSPLTKKAKKKKKWWRLVQHEVMTRERSCCVWVIVELISLMLFVLVDLSDPTPCTYHHDMLLLSWICGGDYLQLLEVSSGDAESEFIII